MLGKVIFGKISLPQNMGDKNVEVCILSKGQNALKS